MSCTYDDYSTNVPSKFLEALWKKDGMWKRNIVKLTQQNLWKRHLISESLSLHFNGHFPGEPGLAGVYWSKGWWKWWWQLHYCSYRSCKAPVKSSPQTNQHPVLFTGLMPFLSPNQQCQSTEGKISHSMDLLTPSSPGVFHLCLWPPIAPGNLGGWLPCLWSALWCQCPPWRKICNRAFRSEFFWNSLNTSLCHRHVLFSIITDNSVKSFHCISSLCPPICFE